MIPIAGTNLLIGTDVECGADIPTLHACKNPCWVGAVGAPKLDKDDPRYLYVGMIRPEAECYDLFLNMIDPPLPLFQLPMFTRALDWLDEHKDDERVLIHCNAGLSRAPSLALLWLDKRATPMTELPQRMSTFALARAYFTGLYPAYAPGAGLVTYLSDHWGEIV